MQGEIADLDPPATQSLKELGGEVQPGGWRRHRSRRRGKDRLIAFPVKLLRLTANVGRERDFPGPFQGRQEITDPLKAHTTQVVVSAVENRRDHPFRQMQT